MFGDPKHQVTAVARGWQQRTGMPTTRVCARGHRSGLSAGEREGLSSVSSIPLREFHTVPARRNIPSENTRARTFVSELGVAASCHYSSFITKALGKHQNAYEDSSKLLRQQGPRAFPGGGTPDAVLGRERATTCPSEIANQEFKLRNFIQSLEEIASSPQRCSTQLAVSLGRQDSLEATRLHYARRPCLSRSTRLRRL